MSQRRASSIAGKPQVVWTIVAAGGAGLRFGSRKQFAELAGRSVLLRSIDAAVGESDGVVVVLPEDSIDEFTATGETVVVAGGSSRAESVRAGLSAVPEKATVILVHDAARPLASPELFGRVVEAVIGGAVAVVPVVAVADTIRSVEGGVVDRDGLRAVQTPQGFAAATLREAHASGAEATDDATLVEQLGYEIETVQGEAANRKLTEPSELVSAAALIEYAEERS